jgi:ferredoxin
VHVTQVRIGLRAAGFFGFDGGTDPTEGEAVAMRVSVDFDLCASTGNCMHVCPEVFEVRDDGYLYVLQEEPPESLRQKVEQAASMCPTAAISVSET